MRRLSSAVEEMMTERSGLRQNRSRRTRARWTIYYSRGLMSPNLLMRRRYAVGAGTGSAAWASKRSMAPLFSQVSMCTAGPARRGVKGALKQGMTMMWSLGFDTN